MKIEFEEFEISQLKKAFGEDIDEKQITRMIMAIAHGIDGGTWNLVTLTQLSVKHIKSNYSWICNFKEGA